MERIGHTIIGYTKFSKRMGHVRTVEVTPDINWSPPMIFVKSRLAENNDSNGFLDIQKEALKHICLPLQVKPIETKE